ncbi:glycoside hydrolase family 105 protein [Massilia sp. TS11]|uniref:glycoside hydrolase family 88/105 protein n=1 Tax=Massilia sp. TS11 TaxID=2908003 RepID=UPI001EDA8ED6|nr:glycoside hydrolase family 88 protein [Massilia sp. TS11]MCG2583940.1 glycoside hydrolase family 88 protein [Massilia sp. TS11]
MKLRMIALAAGLLALSAQAAAPKKAEKVNDVTTPLHAMKPDYPTPYGAPKTEDVKAVLDRVFTYLDQVTPAKLVDKTTKADIADLSKAHPNAMLAQGDYRLTSYEWGVTYAGMLQTGAVTGDKRYTDYTFKRLDFLAALTKTWLPLVKANPATDTPLKRFLDPHALDDTGAICASAIKARRMGISTDLSAYIELCSNFVSKKEYRLADGTLARMRPLANTIWLDDLFMAVPALAQMGKLSGDKAYYDDAVKQVLQFSKRMFNPQLGIYMHGWVEGMSMHPEFHWARANGWAVMTMVELLDVLPPEHPGYKAVQEQLRAHIKGLAAYQDGTGFWHQLIDRPETYLETSATAIYTFAIARAVNRGYVDRQAYAPVAMLGWNAVATKVAANGQVNGTCVGTGMGFDPAFYAYRPVNPYAAHSYGPVLLAGSEIITMLKSHEFEQNDSAFMLKRGL